MGTSHAHWLGLAVTLTFVACNVFTGADDVRFAEDDDDGSGNNTGVGGTGVGGGGGTGLGSSVPLAAADTVSIIGIDIYQGVRRPLMQNGGPAVSNVPLVAGREAMMRVFFNASNYNGQPITARLTIGDAEPIVEQRLLNGGVSNQPDLSSTINLDIPGDLMTGAGYKVEILQAENVTSGNNANATYPASGQESLPVQNAGNQLKIVLVPIAYGADGSNRLPDISDFQIGLYENMFYRLYPTPSVDITVLPTFQWNQTVAANGAGWSELLNSMIDYRQSNGAANDEYYYGIFTSTSSFGSYCGGGCILGLSMLAGPADPMARVGIGIGFTGDVSTETAAHEIGHQHGRGHAPCGANSGLDPGFPYSNGALGEWGYDLVDKLLLEPNTYADFMSYCNPTWVSDYHFGKLFDRIKFVNGAELHFPPELMDRTYSRVIVEPDGSARWTEPLKLHTPPVGLPSEISVITSKGAQKLAGHYYPFSHIGGGLLLYPHQPQPVTKLDVVLQGRAIRLSR